jgi:Fe-S cluster assembly protein SufD
MNSNIKFYSSIINYEDNEYKQNINHNDKDSISKIINHCINVYDNKFKFIVNGKIKKDSINSSFKQDNKIININNGKSFILPNLIVDNNDIDASHSAYIGTFDEDLIFYMMTRGLSLKECNSLLIKSFLLGSMDLDDRQRDILNSIIEKVNM